MPLKGFIDPSHDVLEHNMAGTAPPWLTLPQLLERARHASPKWSHFNYELIKAIIGEHQERDYISTTMLTGSCPRSAVLERREDYVDDLAANWATLRGTFVHRTLEAAARPDAVAEGRFFTEIDGIEFSCSPDLTDGEYIWDYKVTDNVPYNYPWPNHAQQLQFNRYVVNNAVRWINTPKYMPFEPGRAKFAGLIVVYLGPKQPKPIMVTKSVKVQYKNGNYGPKRVPRVDTDQEVETVLLPRFRAMVKALELYPQWPDGLEREPGWGGPPGWTCPGRPWCYYPACLAKRYPNGLIWPQEGA